MGKNVEWIVIALFLFCASTSAAPRVPDDKLFSLSYCEMLSQPEKYDKQTIVSQALIHSNDHAILVYDSNCKSTSTGDRSASIEFPNGQNSTKLLNRLSKILRHDRTARVTFEAVFYSSGQPYGPEGTRFHFVAQRILSVVEERGDRREERGDRRDVF